jgi:CheY-like chemotaxis protein
LAKRILLADDSVTAQNMGRKILNDAGYEVTTVNNGSAALKRITEQRPELIVLDVYMPGYTGLEVCQRIKSSPETAGIPVLLTVGKLEPFKADEAKRVHADAFIIKPFEATELLTVLGKLEDKIIPLPAAKITQVRTPASSRSTKLAAETSVAPAPARATPAEKLEAKKEDKSADPDTGWKSRLAIPSRSREAEPEAPTPTAFHDLRSAKSAEAANPGPAFAVNLPPDITSEEIAAISAAAASLTGEELPAEELPEGETDEPVAEFRAQTASVPESPAPEWKAASQYEKEIHQEYASIVQAAALDAHAVIDSPPQAAAESEAAPEAAFSTFASTPASEEVPESPAEFSVAAAEASHQPQEEQAVAAVAGVPGTEPVVAPSAASSAESSAESSAASSDPPVVAAAAETAAEEQQDEVAEIHARLSDSEVSAALEALAPLEIPVGVAAGEQSPLPSAESLAADLPSASSLVENLYSFKWIAQEVPLDQSVSTLILEQEMQKVYATIGAPDAESVAAAAESEIARDAAAPAVLQALHSDSWQSEKLHSAASQHDDAQHITSQPQEGTFVAAGSEAITVRQPSEEMVAEECEQEAAASVAALGFVAQTESEPAPPVEAIAQTAESGQVTVSPEAAEQPELAQAVSDHARSEQAVSDQGEQHLAEQGQAERDLAGQDLTGQDLAEQDRAEQHLAEQPLAEADQPAPAAEGQAAPQLAAAEAEPAVDAVAEIEVAPASDAPDPAGAVGSETATVHGTAESLEEEPPAALAAAASASSSASTAPAPEFAPVPPAVRPAQDYPSALWDDDDQPPDVAAAWARWRQIRDTLATPEFTAQLADAAAELTATDSHVASHAATADFKDIRHTEPAANHAEAEPESRAASTAPSADSAVISSIVESVLAELKPRLVEEIARKLGNK